MKVILPKSEIKPNQELCAMIGHTFNALVKELGLTDVNEDVVLCFWKMESMSRFGSGDGATDAMARNPIKMNIGMHPPGQMLDILAHEMVHVRQMVRDELKVDDDNITFKGEKIPAIVTQFLEAFGAYRAPPWEKEAYNLGPQLAAKIIAEFPDEMFEFLMRDEGFRLGVNSARMRDAAKLKAAA